ncbi:PfkB family carbohydrate kinase [Serratia odorifera]|uniref:PfkB family carbohydrate kinase n=1 Tax=Serratia odorifera TaxID=618 RepID=UPI001E491319|nr:PfkB family carbohydrate kinase [Serratia odorifera]
MTEFNPLSPVLVLGGAIAEAELRLPQLPRSAQPQAATAQQQQVGGSAFRVAGLLRQLDVPVINGMPVGNGPWAAAIATAMNTLNLPVLLHHGQMDNGWRLTLTGENGEHSVITVAGCETQWNKAQLATLPLTPETLVYLNGDPLTGESGEVLREWLTRLPYDQWRLLAPGPQLEQLGEDFFAMLSDSHTLLSLDRQETALLCGAGNAVEVAQRYAAAHNISLICRLAEEGVWICSGKSAPQHCALDAASGAEALDNVDAHCAGLLAGLSAGWTLPQAVELANRVAAGTLPYPPAVV